MSVREGRGWCAKMGRSECALRCDLDHDLEPAGRPATAHVVGIPALACTCNLIAISNLPPNPGSGNAREESRPR